MTKHAAKSIAVALPATPTAIAIRDASTLAVAAGSQIHFVDLAGTVLATTECRLGAHDPFEAGIVEVTALADGRVVACPGGGARELRVARRGDDEAARWIPPEASKDVALGGSVAWRDGFAALGASEVFLVPGAPSEPRVLRPWSAGAVKSVVAWRRGVLVSSSSETVAYDDDGGELFRAAGDDPLVVDDGLVVCRGAVAVLDDDGREQRVLATDVALHEGRRGYERAWLRAGDDLVIAKVMLARWSVRTGARLWQTGKLHQTTWRAVSLLDGGKRIATFAPPPFVRGEDTTIGVFDTASGAEVARLIAKAPVLDVAPFGGGVVARVHGRGVGHKLLLWRDPAVNMSSPELIGDHTGTVRGLRALPDGRLLSWADDRSLRIWTI